MTDELSIEDFITNTEMSKCGKPFSVNDMAKNVEITYDSARKVLNRLTDNGVYIKFQGPAGGSNLYQLKTLSKASLCARSSWRTMSNREIGILPAWEQK